MKITLSPEPRCWNRDKQGSILKLLDCFKPHVNGDITLHSVLILPRVRGNELRFSHWCPGLIGQIWQHRLVQYLQDPWPSFHGHFLFWGIQVQGCFFASDLHQCKSWYLDLGTWKHLWISYMDMTCRLRPLSYVEMQLDASYCVQKD